MRAGGRTWRSGTGFEVHFFWASLVAQTKESAHNADGSLIPGLWKIPWRREWLQSVFLPEEFHGRVEPVGYSPWDQRGRDMTVSNTLTFSTLFCLGKQCHFPACDSTKARMYVSLISSLPHFLKCFGK